MKRAIVLGLLLLPSVAYAQQTVKAGGIDQRVPALEKQYLAQETANTMQQAMEQAARAAAMLTIEKADHEAAKKAISDAAAYWRAWCGDRPGCSTLGATP